MIAFRVNPISGNNRRRLAVIALVVAGVGAVASLILLPLGLYFLVIDESFYPSTISWDAKNAWAKCDHAISGSLPWPDRPGASCDVMNMCANEAALTAKQYDQLVAEMRKLPGCGDP
jgi:hypothetical protein